MLSVLNGTSPDPSSIFGNTLNLSNAQNAANQNNNAGNAAMMQGLGQIFAYLARTPQGGGE